jgi:NosR/NirI family transcriptional regulator, nitrous oxide reductase regulator
MSPLPHSSGTPSADQQGSRSAILEAGAAAANRPTNRLEKIARVFFGSTVSISARIISHVWSLARPILPVLLLCCWTLIALAEQRFPPPDFETGYKLPSTPTPPARGLMFAYLDVAVLLITLGLACYFILRRRSRRAVFGLSLFSLAYFGFYRRGCLCAIGSIQNVALGFADPNYAIPLTALAFFLAPLAVALFAGRTFCAAVCPHGALQDLVLLKPLKVPSWLEHGLGILPYVYLGAAVAFTAAGSPFLICRFDPFVPFFRLSGSTSLVLLGAGFLVAGIFIGRPYCRFLCPYGALLKLAAKVSKWRVTITPDVCTQCRLCEESCPYGAIQDPVTAPLTAPTLATDRRRLSLAILLLPILLLGGGWFGAKLGSPAARLNPTVTLAERYLTEKKSPVPLGVQTAAALSLSRADQDPKGLLTRAVEIRGRFQRAGQWFGVWLGLVLGVKLIFLSLRQRRTDYEPDRGGCLACARCFASCPNERMRCGLLPLEAPSAPTPASAGGPGSQGTATHPKLSETT